MVLNPDVHIKAQSEIDRVMGPLEERLSDSIGRVDLPYVEAVMREVVRWHPPVPLCGFATVDDILSETDVVLCLTVPRTSTEDDVYNGYFIPGNSTAIINIW